jgi:uncharacterized membrane protein YphA (DoxX/SURF4 family)
MDMRNRRVDFGALIIGRLLVGGMYLGAGIGNLVELDARIGYAASKGLPSASFFVTTATLLLCAGAASLLAGFRPQLGVAAIAVFLFGVTPVMHNFWALQGFERELEFHTFMGNVGLLGGAILALAIPRPWPLSLDRFVASLADRRVASAPSAA